MRGREKGRKANGKQNSDPYEYDLSGEQTQPQQVCKGMKDLLAQKENQLAKQFIMKLNI